MAAIPARAATGAAGMSEVTALGAYMGEASKLTEHVKAVRGTPCNPMTREEIIAKSPRSDYAGAGGGDWREADRAGARSGKREERTGVGPLLQRA